MEPQQGAANVVKNEENVPATAADTSNEAIKDVENNADKLDEPKKESKTKKQRGKTKPKNTQQQEKQPIGLDSRDVGDGQSEQRNAPENPEEFNQSHNSEQEATVKNLPALEPPLVQQFQREKLLGVIVHCTDRLKTKLFITHPLVKMHVLDIKTGQYLKKSDPSKPASYCMEKEIDVVLPLMTKLCNLRAKGNSKPSWEELLVVNEDYEYCFSQYVEVLLVFELLDFTSMTVAKGRFERSRDSSSGWYRIAWAFLKLVGGNGEYNARKRFRLQLYRAPAAFAANRTIKNDVFQWWEMPKRVKYPATLYVTVKPLSVPEKIEPAVRSMSSLQMERGVSNPYLDAILGGAGAELENTKDEKELEDMTDKPELSIWNRLPGQPCSLPNKLMLSLPAGKLGCLRTSFSPNGRILACAVKESSTRYPVLLYDIPSGVARGSLLGHMGPVYDICWSFGSQKLLTASGDCTVRLWSMHDEACMEVLAHSSFVYAVKVHPSVDTLVLTGSFDKLIRIWEIPRHENNPNAVTQVIAILSDHPDFVNVLQFQADGRCLYSGDGSGVLRVWSTSVDELPGFQAPSTTIDGSCFRRQVSNWKLKREQIPEVGQDKCINTILLHPDGKRMFILRRECPIQCLDCRLLVPIQTFVGATTAKLPGRCCLSSLGKFLFCGGDQTGGGGVQVWLAGNGELVANYPLSGDPPVVDVAFHPFDDILVIAALGQFQPVFLHCYDSHVPEIHQPSNDSAMEKLSTKPTSAEGSTSASSTDYLSYSVQKLLQEHKLLLRSSEELISIRQHRNPFSSAQQTPSTHATPDTPGDRTRGLHPKRGSRPASKDPVPAITGQMPPDTLTTELPSISNDEKCISQARKRLPQPPIQR